MKRAFLPWDLYVVMSRVFPAIRQTSRACITLFGFFRSHHVVKHRIQHLQLLPDRIESRIPVQLLQFLPQGSSMVGISFNALAYGINIHHGSPGEYTIGCCLKSCRAARGHCCSYSLATVIIFGCERPHKMIAPRAAIVRVWVQPTNGHAPVYRRESADKMGHRNCSASLQAYSVLPTRSGQAGRAV